MSARSVRRAREREMRREQRRASRRASRLGIGAGGALAAALVVAPAASAATFTVTKTADTDDSACIVADPECSLREALNAVNSNGSDDVINFAAGVTGTINLDQNFGDLDIRNDGLEIQGPGADTLTISGGGHDRIFKLFGFNAPDEQVLISGLRLAGGTAGSDGGGAIWSTETGFTDEGDIDDGVPADLTVAGAVIEQSDATYGGGIAVERIFSGLSGGLTVRDTTIDGNSAEHGGGIFAALIGDRITIARSTLSNNTATQAAGGGGAYIESGSEALIENSTIASNHADDGVGGGIRFRSFGNPDPRTIRNSTIAGNSAGEGGGIFVSGAERSNRGFDPAVEVALSSTIVADNSADTLGGDADGPDLRSDDASFNAGFSLLEVTTGATVTAAPPGSNITGQDPLLGPLAGNGGTTQTKLPATASPVIDAGAANGLATEQRGTARTVDRLPANASDGTDIGAVELPRDPYEEVPAPRTTRCLGDPFLVKRGSAKGERIEGTPDRDGIFAHAGRDTVLGLEADDCLFGGVDEDKLKGGSGEDRVNGDPDDDSVHGNDGRDDVRGQNGADRVFGGAGGDDRVTGGTGDDRVFGGPGDDKLIKGDGGNDVLDLGSGNDFVHAGGGRDRIGAVDGEVDRVICGTGHDVAFVDPGDSVLPDCNTVHVVN